MIGELSQRALHFSINIIDLTVEFADSERDVEDYQDEEHDDNDQLLWQLPLGISDKVLILP